MAEYTLPPQSVLPAGIKPTYYAIGTMPALANGTLKPTGDQFLVPNNGAVVLYVVNRTKEAVIDIETPVTIDGLAVADRSVTVGADENRVLGPFPRAIYGNPFKFAIADVKGVQVAVLRI